MRKVLFFALLASSMVLPTTALAEEEAATYIYGTYFSCSGSMKRVNELVDSVGKPAYDAAVKAGEIKGWGWMTHNAGGNWSAVLYHSGGSVPQVLAADPKINDRIDDEAAEEFGQLCTSHDDYIWRGITGSGGNVLSTKRGKVGLSVYYVCDSREAAADDIVETVFAPVYNAHVGAGKLTSWGWSEHIIGGKYRRLATITAADWTSLFAARDEIIEAGQDNALAAQFSEICHSHTDYLWDIKHEAP